MFTNIISHREMQNNKGKEVEHSNSQRAVSRINNWHNASNNDPVELVSTWWDSCLARRASGLSHNLNYVCWRDNGNSHTD